jgi:acyl-Coa thioesterase superfamily protein/acyl-CoA thioesterase superfamily protein
VPDTLYTAVGDLLVPGPMTQGPWSPDAQHGGAVAALLVRTAERAPAPGAMQVARLTVELLRPVPLRPLLASATVSRPGRKVQIVDARLVVDGQDVAWARALRIRSAPVDVPPQEPQPTSPPLPTDSGPPRRPSRTPFADAVDLRFLSGGWDELGPVRMWTRLTVPVVAGEEPSAMQRTAAAADFGNGVSRIVDFETHMFINPDLTVSLSRVPVGEWIGFDVVSRLSPDGYGQAESLIFDPAGPVGRSVQSLLVERR